MTRQIHNTCKAAFLLARNRNQIWAALTAVYLVEEREIALRQHLPNSTFLTPTFFSHYGSESEYFLSYYTVCMIIDSACTLLSKGFSGLILKARGNVGRRFSEELIEICIFIVVVSYKRELRTWK